MMTKGNIYHSISDQFILVLQNYPDFDLTGEKTSRLFISLKDYFIYQRSEYYEGARTYVYPGGPHSAGIIDFDENLKENSEYKRELLEWENFCVNSYEGRLALRRIFSYWIERRFIYIEEKIQSGKLPDYIVEEKAQDYLRIGKSGNFNLETLENLITFDKIFRLCFDELAYSVYEEGLEEYDYNQGPSYEEEKYTWEDSYRDAGGGDEWSDPSEFWG